MSQKQGALPVSMVILLGMSAFVMLKIPDLSLPYFWDEMAGYMSCVIQMWDHGISVLPSAVPAELSYGHPLLMHTCLALAGKVFGMEPVVMHAMVLFFTLMLSLGVYLLAKELSHGDTTTGLLAFFVFLVQPIVFAQSTQVVLEVFLAMHVVYAIYFHLRKNYLLSMLFTVFAVLTKETGLVLVIAMLCEAVYRLLIKDQINEQKSKLLFYLVPVLVFVTYLQVTKEAFGWYLNPVNVGKSKLNLGSMLQKIWDYPLEFSFKDQGRWAYTLLFVLALFLPGSAIRKFRFNIRSRVVLILIYVFGFVLFSSVADTLLRYFLNLIPWVAVWFAMAYAPAFKHNPLLLSALLLVCAFISYQNLNPGDKNRDTDMSYVDMVRTNQAVIEHLNNGEFEEDTVGFVFPLNWAVVDPRFGYYEQLRFVPDTSFKAISGYKVFCKPGNMDWQQKLLENRIKVWDTCIRTSEVSVFQ